MRLLYANCFPPAGHGASVCATDEPAVAGELANRGAEVLSGEDLVSPDLAHEVSIALWRMAFAWYRTADGDPTVTAGISAGDLAGLEVAIAVLAPAARGALAMSAALQRTPEVSELVVAVPRGLPADGRYDAVEAVAAEAMIAAARHVRGDTLAVTRLASSDVRNASLRAKYERTRDPEILLRPSASRLFRGAVLRATASLAGRVRRRPGASLLILEYNPTLAFAREYASRRRRHRLVRWISDPSEIIPALAAGDAVAGPPLAPLRASHVDVNALRRREADLAGTSFTVAGVPLWPVVGERLIGLVARYLGFATARAAAVRRALERDRVAAVLVPYDMPPAARLLVRVAQSLAIPTYVLNDGYKADEIQLEGMSTDVALAWSSAVAEGYFARHPGRVHVTGNPRASKATARPWRGVPERPLRVLVGTFTFSPVDLNCRRADAERFLAEVLDALARARPAVAESVLVKLHPADETAHYEPILARYRELRVELISRGDVIDLLDRADVYVTTYSTSLLEALTSMPALYYRVNEQRLGAPFSGDGYLAARTASNPRTLAQQLRDRDLLRVPPPTGWAERYLGPAGAGTRVAECLEHRAVSVHVG